MVCPENSSHGPRFLHRLDSDLHRSAPVELEQARRHQRSRIGQTALDSGQIELEPHHKPADKISDWLGSLETIHRHHNTDPAVADRIKSVYHDQLVIQPDSIPESVFQLEAKIARDLGYGDIEITDQYREVKTNEIITAQTESLDAWLDYLSSDDAVYPMWQKQLAFNAVTKLGKLDKVTKTDEQGGETTTVQFAKRDSSTVAKFPVLNQQALARTLEAIDAKASAIGQPKADRRPVPNTSRHLSDDQFKQLISTESFGRIYAQFLGEIPEYSLEGLREIRGQWVKYDRGSDPEPLVSSLDGYPLEWCTASLDTARSQLQGGDFYVYYSLDDDQQAKIPRAAIRMERDSIAEVRGIASDQNLDPYIADVVSEKMTDFPDGERYMRKSADMARLTEIYDQSSQNTDISINDLRFLYEIDERIEGFGYGTDPRIDEILASRTARQDIATIFGYQPDQVSTSRDEALSGTDDEPILFHHGHIDLYDLASAKGLKLPGYVGGYIDLKSLTSAEGLKLPDYVGGNLDLHSLDSAEGLKLPEHIGGGLNLSSLTSAEVLKLPDHVGGSLNLSSLASAEGLKLPDHVGSNLDLYSLTSVEGLKLPDHVGGSLSLSSLASVEGLKLPDRVGGSLYLNCLTSAEGLKLPDRVGGSLYLNCLTSAEGLKLPDRVGYHIYLGDLSEKDMAGVKQPTDFGGRIVYMS